MHGMSTTEMTCYIDLVMVSTGVMASEMVRERVAV